MPEKRLSDKLREFLLQAQGKEVDLDYLRKELQIDPNSPAWNGIRQQMVNLTAEKIVKPSGRKDGIYKVISQVTPVKVYSVLRQRRPPLELKFPIDFTTGMELSFAEAIVIREGDLITIGGVKSTGKTQLSLAFCAANIDANPVLMGSEYTIMSEGVYEPAPRFLERLDRMSQWVTWVNESGEDKFTLLPVRDDFAEHVIPNRLNIADWINLDASALYDIGKVLGAFKAAVGRGIGIAVLQKGEGALNPRGGQFVRDFSDVEILLDPFGNNPHDVLLTIKGVKESIKSVVGKTYAYTIGEGGTKIFNFREVKKCPGCGGSRFQKGHDCDTCFGTGFVDK